MQLNQGRPSQTHPSESCLLLREAGSLPPADPDRCRCSRGGCPRHPAAGAVVGLDPLWDPAPGSGRDTPSSLHPAQLAADCAVVLGKAMKKSPWISALALTPGAPWAGSQPPSHPWAGGTSAAFLCPNILLSSRKRSESRKPALGVCW